MRTLLAALALALPLTIPGCPAETVPTYQGWVEADLVFVGAEATGRIQRLDAAEGAEVVAGAPLFQLDATTETADVAAAEAAVASAKAGLAKAETAQQRPEQIDVLEAAKQRAEAVLALSKADFERSQALLARGVVTKAALDEARATYERDQASAQEAARMIVVAKLAARREDIELAQSALAKAEAELAAARTRLDKRTVSAPATGRVQEIYFRMGEVVPVGRPVVAIVPPGNLKVRFFVPEAILPQVGIGDLVSVACDGCRAGLSARVSFISGSAEYTPPVIYSREERAKLVFRVEARPIDAAALRIGQPVTVTFGPAPDVAKLR